MDKPDEKIGQLQMYEQSLQNILMQKQQFQSQLSEIDSALKEMESSTETYRIVGNIMVLTKKEDLKKELEEKNSSVKLRITTLEKQEDSIREKAKSLQTEIMKNMDKNE